jgi:hypothetical protein
MTLKSGQVFVVATCEECMIVSERFIPGGKDVAPLAHLAATDALYGAGCRHAVALTRHSREQTLPEATDLPSRFERERPTSRPPRLCMPAVNEEVVLSAADSRREV